MSALRGVLLEVAYDGTAFSGWAAQRDVRTVEQVLRGAIRAIDPKAEGPRGTSRTDAGVHALGQLAAFDTCVEMPPRGWVLSLNQHLPEDASVRRARLVEAGYAPRFASKSKRYAYHLLFDKVRDPRHRDRAWRIGYEMSIEKMMLEAHDFVGTHDFRAFRNAGDMREDTVRTIHSVEIVRDSRDPRHVIVTVEGSAFLYNMVRIIVGTLVDVGRGHLPVGSVQRALSGGDRSLAGQTAPAPGLVLESISIDLPPQASDAWPP